MSHSTISPARRALGPAHGAVPAGTTVFDDAPAVANLDPDLLAALRRAAAAAAGEGVVFLVNGGWRSPAYQEELLSEAVAEHGSPEAAARWVSTPETSAHVAGRAIDLGRDARAWLAVHGGAYGLHRVYRNEPWHFELWPWPGPPPLYADPSHDPRTRR
ncbi:D-alanyl-D-alanine carboxypeptidase family protein [Glycomyces mayteni]|uniref:D-alanyl-D-alanine carboxypeptidase family protein n=1 Tax=Glycomyces mayteni TaxID=543887 RepID=A0ABW2D2R1_9ACTN